jgi:O-phosphoseryl-tRNA synthetase
VSDCLVVLTAVEKGDAENVTEVVGNARGEIVKLSEELKAEKIVLYPYTHLSSNLSSPLQAIEVLRQLKEVLSSYDVTVAPFGWYKAFNIQCKGHPRSESLREIAPHSVAKERVKKSAGRPHPISNLNQRFREIFLDLGFDEVINPSIIQDKEIYKQYGPEAPLILDRVFYLAGLPRPDIGISQADMDRITALAPGFDRMDTLQNIFRDYKKGDIESDDFIDHLVRQTGLQEEIAIRVIDEVFPGLKNLTPEHSNKTLRSHMTSLWFPLLENAQKHRQLPLKLFAIGPRFRREQREDASHLFESTTASIVVMDTDFTLDDGKDLTAHILRGLGLHECDFRLKEVTSNYYEHDTDTEIFVKIGGNDMEVANIGFYSAEALARYHIKHPVFNLGFGVERIAMAYEHAVDMRAFVYPLLYEPEIPTDEEVADTLKPQREPTSDEGKAISEKLIRAAMEHRDDRGPSEILAYEGSLLGSDIRVFVYNWDEGKPLLSFAALNTVVVHECNIYGLPVDHPKLPAQFRDIVEKGVRTDFIFLNLMMTGVAAELENAVREKEQTFDRKFRMIKHPAQVNLDIPPHIYNIITSCQKHIKVSGPVFAGVRAEIATK